MVLLGFAASVYGFGFLAQSDAFFISGNHSTCVGSLDFAGGVALGTFGLLLVLGGAIFYFAGRRTMRRDR